jgi:hypothetical protein
VRVRGSGKERVAGIEWGCLGIMLGVCTLFVIEEGSSF